jgi:hypothetical protein
VAFGISLFFSQQLRPLHQRSCLAPCLFLRSFRRRSGSFGSIPCRRTRLQRIRLGKPSGSNSQHVFNALQTICRPGTSSITSRTSPTSRRGARCLRGLFGSCDVLYLSPAAESSSASGSTTVSSGSRAYAGETSRQGGTVHAGTPQSTEHVGSRPTAGRGSTMRDADCLAFWGCLRLGALIPKREEKKRQCLRLQNLEVRGTSIIATVHISKTIQFGERQHRIEVPAQSDQLLCPLRALTRWISALQRPSSQTPIVRAVHDQSYNAVSFAIPDPGESHRPFNQPSLGSLVPSGLRSSGIRSQCANMASDASRRLEDSGSGHVVCRGRAHSKPTGRPVEPRPVREGWFPPD